MKVDGYGRILKRKNNNTIKDCPLKNEDSFKGENAWPAGASQWNSWALTDYLMNQDLAPFITGGAGNIERPQDLIGSISKSRNPSRTLTLVDGKGYSYGGIIGEYLRTRLAASNYSVRYRHSLFANILMLDGHCEAQRVGADPGGSGGLNIAYQVKSGSYWNTYDIILWE